MLAFSTVPLGLVCLLLFLLGLSATSAETARNGGAGYVRPGEGEAVVDEVEVFEVVYERGPTGGGECTNTSEVICEGHGDCIDEVCVCYKGWAGPYCHHELKEKLTAFLLEFFIGAPTGAGSFYLGYIGQGIGKLILYWFGCILMCCATPIVKVALGEKAGLAVACVNLFAVVLPLAATVWSLANWIMILADDLDDYDGYHLNGF